MNSKDNIEIEDNSNEYRTAIIIDNQIQKEPEMQAHMMICLW